MSPRHQGRARKQARTAARRDDEPQPPKMHRVPSSPVPVERTGNTRKFSVIHEDPAALDKLRAEAGGDPRFPFDEAGSVPPAQTSSFGRGSFEHQSGSFQHMNTASSNSRFLDGYSSKRRRVHLQSADLFDCYSPVQKERLKMVVEMPNAFKEKYTELSPTFVPGLELYDADEIRQYLPILSNLEAVEIRAISKDDVMTDDDKSGPINVGIVLSGGPAPGGHNVIAGVFDYIKQINPDSTLIGFKGGLDGLFKCEYKEITHDLMDRFRNTGGFDMIWSGRGKVTDEEKAVVKKVLRETNLSGLIIVGGDGSNSNAALLAEFVAEEMPDVSVVGVPKTIDGDLKNEAIECSFGFDTAAKTYSESIGNLCVDSAIGQGIWHFVRVMGRSASHLVMECAMQCRPNLVFIGEEVERDSVGLKDIVNEIADVVEARWAAGRHYGVVLVPEGLIEFIPEVKNLMDELNGLIKADSSGHKELDSAGLSPKAREIWNFLPPDDRQLFLADRESSGYVQVAKIATERLLLHCTEDVLRDRGRVPIKSWNRMHHYFGYEGRCAMPSNFDAGYCYALGRTAGCLVHHERNGYMAVVKDLKNPVADWRPMGVPFTQLMSMVNLSIGRRPGIRRQLVDLNSPAFKTLCQVRPQWKLGDYYRCPGPVQFAGPVSAITNYVVNPPTENDLLAGDLTEDQELQLVGRAVVPPRLGCYSQLQKERLRSIPQCPPLCNALYVTCQNGSQHLPNDPYVRRQVHLAFPHLCNDNQFYIKEFSLASQLNALDSTMDDSSTPQSQQAARGSPCVLAPSCKVGVVFLSRHAPGIQNILWGVHERCKKNGGVCYGFKGVEGLFQKDYIEVTDEDLSPFKNLGGSHLLGRALEHMLLSDSQEWEKVRMAVTELDLTGLVLVGSSLAMTEASNLAEYFKRKRTACCVIGVPATASNNLGGDLIEANIGFDTASKLYSSLIGNVLTDAASMPKYWHFVRLMGRQPSNEVLECALQTHPNVVIVAEEYGAAQKTLQQVVEDIADVVCRRAESDDMRRNFGAVIIPDGLWHHLPTFRMTMTDVDQVMAKATQEGLEREAIDMLLSDGESTSDETSAWLNSIPPWSLAVWKSLPAYIRQELLSSDKELRFTYVETERLLSQMVANELEKRKARGEYKGVFQCVCHYFGYQGRSAMPSVFDATLGYVHGHLAVMCIEQGLTGHLTTIRGLCGKINSWKLGAVPFNCLLTMVPCQQSYDTHPKMNYKSATEALMVANAEIQLTGKAFRWLKIARNTWEMQDRFCNPGPIQFWGPAAAYYHRILHEEQAEYSRMLHHTQRYAQMLKDACDFGVNEQYLKFVFTSLHGLLYLRHHNDNLVEDIGRIRPPQRGMESSQLDEVTSSEESELDEFTNPD